MDSDRADHLHIRFFSANYPSTLRGLAARKNARALAQRGPYTGCAVEDEDAGKDESDHVDRKQRRPRAQLLHDPHDG